MRAGRSNYYPPRAGRRVFLRPISIPFRRWLGYVPLPHFGELALSPKVILLSLLIPGYIFSIIGPRKFFIYIILGYLLALLVFFIWLGQVPATIAFMAMLSAHVSSVAQMIKHLTPSFGLKFRIISTVAVFLILNVLVYGFAQEQLGRVLSPLRTNDKVVVVRSCSPDKVKVRDTIAYRVERDNTHGFVVAEGFGYDRVLAKGGDVIQFGKESYQVNSTVYPREPNMPQAGEIVVPDGHWFVWPKFKINMRLSESDISKRTMLYAMIGTDDLVGKPFKYWFWRKQL